MGRYALWVNGKYRSSFEGEARIEGAKRSRFDNYFEDEARNDGQSKLGISGKMGLERSLPNRNFLKIRIKNRTFWCIYII